MKIKHDVDLRGLQVPMAIAAAVAESVWDANHEELVITSGTEGAHMAGSLHYRGLAIDIRLPRMNVALLVGQLKAALGPQFDVVLEKDHVHIELDVKTPLPAQQITGTQ